MYPAASTMSPEGGTMSVTMSLEPRCPRLVPRQVIGFNLAAGTKSTAEAAPPNKRIHIAVPFIIGPTTFPLATYCSTTHPIIFRTTSPPGTNCSTTHPTIVSTNWTCSSTFALAARTLVPPMRPAAPLP
eukprot:3886806-Rhodomonas_salina.1